MPENIENKKDLLRAKTQRAHRALALQMLYSIDRSGYQTTVHEIVERFFNNYSVKIEPEDFSVKLVEGVLEQSDELEQTIQTLSANWKTERIGCITKLILKMAIWEISHQANPARVVIDQAVELSKSFCEKDSYKFINGLLDKYFKTLDLEHKEETFQEQA